MPPFKDYYKMLELESFADIDSVKASYRKLARKYHPDLNANNRMAEERFKEINEAYDALNTVDKKKLYDDKLQIVRYGKPSATASGRPQSGGKSSGSQPRDPKRTSTPPPKSTTKTSDQPKAKSAKSAKTEAKEASASDASSQEGSSTPINELFENFFTGFSRRGGDGGSGSGQDKVFNREASRRGEDVTVETTISPQEADEGTVKTVNVQHNELCRKCSGTGKLNGRPCTVCQGEKVIARLKKIDVRIPGGVREGSKVRVASEGGRGQGGAEDGDLYLQIKIAVDPSLRVEGMNVYCEYSISMPEAVLGTEVDVPTLNGSVKLNIPPNTSSGRVLRLKEAGVRNGSQKGDQFVTVHITSPENLSARERELYEELAKIARQKGK